MSYLAVFLTFVGLAIVFLLPTAVAFSGGGGPALIVGVAFFVLVVWLFLRWSLATAAIALDGAGPIQALGRSARVLRGNLWRLLGTFVLFGLLFGPISVAIGSLSLTGTDQLLAFALTLLVGLILTPVTGILLATIYGDLSGRPDAGAVDVDRAGRAIIVVGVLVLGIAGAAIAVPKVGPAIDRLALNGVPAEDRGHLLAGTSRSPFDPCRPSNVRTTFSPSDSIYVGGYFTKPIPVGQHGDVTVFINGRMVNSGQIADPRRPAVCYYERDPLAGAPLGTYRIVVTFNGETIAEGEFVVR